MSDTKAIVFSEQIVINKIYLIRECKVMIDRDLAEMYGVDPHTESGDKTEPKSISNRLCVPINI